MLSATFGDEIVGRDQRNSTDGDIDDRVRFLGSGSSLLGLSLLSHLRELALRRLLLSGLIRLVEQTADTDLGKTWENRSGKLSDASKKISETTKKSSNRKADAINPIRIAERGGELIAHRTGDMIVHRVAKTVGDVLDFSHGLNSDQTIPISGSRYVLGAWVNEN